jgi:hypothetical protein
MTWVIVLKVFFKKIHKDPSNVPLKPLKEGLQTHPPKLACPNPKIGRILFLEKVLNMFGTSKCKRPETFPKFA